MGMTAMAAGTALKGFSEYQYQGTQAEMALADAAAERDAAKQQAQRIMQATQRQRGAARAATAASGARIDEWSLANEQDIEAAGETDAAMAILSGDRKARTLETSAKLHKAAGYQGAASTLFSLTDQFKGWKGGKGVVGNDESGITYSRTGADIRARR